MKFIKNFENHQGYEAYIATDYPKPNVSYCVQENEVHYNPPIPPIGEKEIITKYVTTQEGENVALVNTGLASYPIYFINNIESMEVDGVLLDTPRAFFVFSTVGEHQVKIKLKNNVDYIDDDAFSDCIKLTSVEIGGGVTSIRSNAFSYCSSLTSINIPSGVTSIPYDIFYYCSSLTNIAVDSSNTVYDSRNNCNAIIETSTNTLIQGCKTTVIPNTVTSIGISAFRGRYGLTSINIPSSVTSIGENAFDYCETLTSVTVEATTPPTLGYGVFSSFYIRSIYVPSESVDTYKAADGWSTYASRIQAIPTT